MVLKLIDEVCEYVCSKVSFDKWVNLDEINEIFKGYGLTEAQVEATLNFLKKYFLELDESKQKAKLTPSFHNFYEKILRSKG